MNGGSGSRSSRGGASGIIDDFDDFDGEEPGSTRGRKRSPEGGSRMN